MKRFGLALRLLQRDGRSGELNLLLLALVIAVASTTTISLFADRLQRTLTLQAAEFLAGDLVIASPQALDPQWLQQAEARGLTASQTTEFSSVLLEHEQMLLASIKAVSTAYPLRGFLKTRENATTEEFKTDHGPEAGTAWVEPRVLSALQLQLGDSLTIGEKPLLLTRILTYEPDQRGDFYSFSPRVMMHQQDLPATGIIQPGSHVHYFYQFTGDATQLQIFKQNIKPQLNPSQRILDIHEDRPELGSALQRAERYLGLSGVVVILIAGVAIAMAARRYSERHFNASALLKCLGCQHSEIVGLYSLQFLIVGIVGSLVGCALGWLGQWGLFYLLKPFLPQTLANPGWLAVLSGFVTGMVILLGFALPPWLRLQRVSPLRVLRRELEPLPSRAWLIYLLALSVMTLLVNRFSNSGSMTASIVGVGLLSLLLLGWLISGMLQMLHPLLPRMPLTWRFGVQGLLRYRQTSVSQILAFSITLAAMALNFNVRNDLIEQWQQQLPEKAPNHFALNILPQRLEAFQQDLQQAGIVSSAFYPVIRGRLVAINDEAVQRRVSKDSKGEAATQRELSLTWGETIPEDNKITAGAAWPGDQPGWVSVEEKLAENLKIKLGDRLQFTVGNAQFSAQVANLRSLQWDTMKPNFYMIFSPGTLENFPATYLTSFFVPDTQKTLVNTLLKNYPATTILQVDQLLKQFKAILTQLTRALDLLLYFALAAGVTVLLAGVHASLDQRIQEGALMRTLGTRRHWLRKTHLIEFTLLGALSGLLATAMSQAILWVLYIRVMHMSYHPSAMMLCGLPIFGALWIGGAGFWRLREVVNQAPLQILRRG